jgi:hypothetical protein
MTPEDALEAAKLAASVGGQLKKIDQFTSDRTSNPANKINIQNFINKVRNPRASIRPAAYLASVPAGFAPPPPEEYIQSMVPDTSIGSLPTQTPIHQSIPAEPIQDFLPVVNNTPPEPLKPLPTLMETPIEQQKEANVTFNSSSELKSIAKSLKNIDKTLSNLVQIIQTNSKHDE